MWVSKSAIRPVPAYAKVHEVVLERVRSRLLVDGEDSQENLDREFARFEASQPIVSEKMGEILARPLGEASIALGFFLSLAIWMAFEQALGSALGKVTKEGFNSTSELMKLDEELRLNEENESLETDDVISMEQPALVRFIHEHMEATLDMHADEMDPEDLQLIYRMILIEVLALSYAVKSPTGFPPEQGEMLA